VDHEHAWKLVMHLDGCHFYSSSYSCECGAVRVSRGERKMDGYSAVWALEDCERCQQLLAGATPKHSEEIELP